MLRRIQHFTTQQIPVGTIAGLEPQRSAPRLDSRPEGRPGFGRGGRPGFGGGRPGAGRGGDFRGGDFRGGDFRGGDSRGAPRGGEFQPRPEGHWDNRGPDQRRTGHDARSHGGPGGAGRHDRQHDARPQGSGPRDGGAPRRDAGAPGRRGPRY